MAAITSRVFGVFRLCRYHVSKIVNSVQNKTFSQSNYGIIYFAKRCFSINDRQRYVLILSVLLKKKIKWNLNPD